MFKKYSITDTNYTQDYLDTENILVGSDGKELGLNIFRFFWIENWLQKLTYELYFHAFSDILCLFNSEWASFQLYLTSTVTI